MINRTGASKASQATTRTSPTQARAAAPRASPAKAEATGWRPGATASRLPLVKAAIDEGPATTDGVRAPKGYSAELKTSSTHLKDSVGGAEATFDRTMTTLSLFRPDGKKVGLIKDRPNDGMEGSRPLADEWKETVADAKRAPQEAFMGGLNWSTDSNVRGAGGAGKLVSVMESGSTFTGGAHPNHGSALRTYHADTGKQVKLSELLTPLQMQNLVKDLGAKLPGLKGPSGVDASSFGFSWSQTPEKELRATIDQNFALSTDKKGQVLITVGWESGVHALGGLMANATFKAPDDASFRKAVGLE